MRIFVNNHRSKFYIRCPRCGYHEFSVATLPGIHVYRKCLRCGIDVAVEIDGNGPYHGTRIIATVEDHYKDWPKYPGAILEYIEKDLKDPRWVP